MSKIVSLRGEEITPLGEPLPAVVELAEQLLAMAKSGEARGLFVSVYHVDETHSRRLAGEVTNGVLGSVERLKFAVYNRLENE